MVGDGLCACGCGNKTSISKKTDNKQGDVKGKPKKYVIGHAPKKLNRYTIEDRGYKTSCWVWLLNKNRLGYGKCEHKNKHMRAHIVYYEEKYGPVPEGLQLDHLCRIPSCVNPDHLEPVTAAVNTQRGKSAKINMGIVKEIRLLYKLGERQESLAKQFGISRCSISQIVNNITWKTN